MIMVKEDCEDIGYVGSLLPLRQKMPVNSADIYI